MNGCEPSVRASSVPPVHMAATLPAPFVCDAPPEMLSAGVGAEGYLLELPERSGIFTGYCHIPLSRKTL
jgi:hypothetical protein